MKNSQITLQQWFVERKSKTFNEIRNDTNECILDCISHDDWNAHEIQSFYNIKKFIEIKITKKKIIRNFIIVLFSSQIIVDFIEYRKTVTKSQKDNQSFELSIMSIIFSKNRSTNQFIWKNSKNLPWSIQNKRKKTRKWLSKSWVKHVFRQIRLIRLIWNWNSDAKKKKKTLSRNFLVNHVFVTNDRFTSWNLSKRSKNYFDFLKIIHAKRICLFCQFSFLFSKSWEIWRAINEKIKKIHIQSNTNNNDWFFWWCFLYTHSKDLRLYFVFCSSFSMIRIWYSTEFFDDSICCSTNVLINWIRFSTFFLMMKFVSRQIFRWIEFTIRHFVWWFESLLDRFWRVFRWRNSLFDNLFDESNSILSISFDDSNRCSTNSSNFWKTKLAVRRFFRKFEFDTRHDRLNRDIFRQHFRSTHYHSTFCSFNHDSNLNETLNRNFAMQTDSNSRKCSCCV